MDEIPEGKKNEDGAGTGLTPVGRVGAPRGAEATTEGFYCWVPEDRLIEKTQLVYVDSPAGPTNVRFYGLVSEVFRRSRRADMLGGAARVDGGPAADGPRRPR